MTKELRYGKPDKEVTLSLNSLKADQIHNILTECVSYYINAENPDEKDKNKTAFYAVLKYAKKKGILVEAKPEKVLKNIIDQLNRSVGEEFTELPAITESEAKEVIKMGIAICQEASLKKGPNVRFIREIDIRYEHGDKRVTIATPAPTFGDLKSYTKKKEEEVVNQKEELKKQKIELGQEGRGNFRMMLSQYWAVLTGNEKRANNIKSLRNEAASLKKNIKHISSLKRTEQTLKDTRVQDTDNLDKSSIKTTVFEATQDFVKTQYNEITRKTSYLAQKIRKVASKKALQKLSASLGRLTPSTSQQHQKRKTGKIR
jgi:hypothetical protein